MKADTAKGIRAIRGQFVCNTPNLLTAEHAEYAEAEKQGKGIPLSPFSVWSAYSAVEWIEMDRRSLRASSGIVNQGETDSLCYLRFLL